MSLAVVSVTSFVGMLRHWRQGNVDFRALVIFAPTATVSTYVGALVARVVPEMVQMVGLGMVMGVTALLMWGGGFHALAARISGGQPKVTEPLPAGPTVPRIDALVGIGLGLGFLTGILGVGGGFLIVPALVLLLKLEMKLAVGTSLGVIALNSAAGFAGYLSQVTMDWTLIAGFTAAAIVGVFAGAALVPKVSQEQLRRGFAIFLALVAVYILVRR
jgi:uncharacterized membrane protein YfcA